MRNKVFDHLGVTGVHSQLVFSKIFEVISGCTGGGPYLLLLCVTAVGVIFFYTYLHTQIKFRFGTADPRAYTTMLVLYFWPAIVKYLQVTSFSLECRG